MTIADNASLELERRSTSCTSFTLTTGLSIALMLAEYAQSPQPVRVERFDQVRSDSTVAHPLVQPLSEVQVLEQLSRVLDDLVNGQVELDSDSKRALYGNLWDLYA